MSRLWAMAIKEFIEIRRDPRTLGLVLFMPILLLILFGFAITFDIRQIPTAVCDRDRSSQSRALVQSFTSSGYFKLIHQEACGKQDALLDRGTIRIFIEIPPDFGNRLVSKTASPIQVLIDGSDNNTANVSNGYVEQVLRNFSLDKVRSPFDKGLKEGVVVQSRIWFNPDMKSTIFITPGIIGMLIMIIGVAIPAMAVVRERELGNLEILISSPIRPVEVILGKMLPYGLICFG